MRLILSALSLGLGTSTSALTSPMQVKVAYTHKSVGRQVSRD